VAFGERDLIYKSGLIRGVPFGERDLIYKSGLIRGVI
jgi:hypothetical protein